jgi:hydroxymethylpyrimidine pyrophosphatase-like HAD family hydrolase
MRFLALATDYDGTLADAGRVDEATVDALERLHASGRRAILVTGRQLEDLARVFPRLDLFEAIVAENGAVLHLPSSRETMVLAPPPSIRFLGLLRDKGVDFDVGRVVVATSQPHASAVLDAIRELGLELGLTYNKGSAMVLPSGVDKATGLEAACRRLRLSPRDIAGIGDAENDRAFLDLCGCAVAVADALPSLRDAADYVTAGRDGAGVRELIGRLLASDPPPVMRAS